MDGGFFGWEELVGGEGGFVDDDVGMVRGLLKDEALRGGEGLLVVGDGLWGVVVYFVQGFVNIYRPLLLSIIIPIILLFIRRLLIISLILSISILLL